MAARPVMSAGAGCMVVASVGIAFAVGELPVTPIVGLLGLSGLGIGLLSAPQTAMALSSVSREVAGAASGTFSMMRYVGSVTGAAMIAAVLGGHASATEFHALFAILAVFAVVNMSTAFAVHSSVAREPGGHPATEPLVTRT